MFVGSFSRAAPPETHRASGAQWTRAASWLGAVLVHVPTTVDPMNEAEFEQAIVDAARIFDWRVVGHRPMRTKNGWATGWKYDGTGWPDLTMVHADRGLLITAELKTEKGRLSDDQIEWGQRLEALEANLPGFAYYVWRPDDWTQIVALLSAGAAR